MNFELNEQQLSIQKMAREFTEKRWHPRCWNGTKPESMT